MKLFFLTQEPILLGQAFSLALKLPDATEINSYHHWQQWQAVSGPSLPWQIAALAQNHK